MFFKNGTKKEEMSSLPKFKKIEREGIKNG